jgi:hypothetical protein
MIREEFFRPLFELFHSAKHRWVCPALDDATWVEAGVRRCLGIFQSGRDFLQQLADLHDTPIGVTTFFQSLKSKRRLRLLDELRWSSPATACAVTWPTLSRGTPVLMISISLPATDI